MSDNEQNSSSKNEINQNELYYDLQSKEDNKVLKSIVKGYKKMKIPIYVTQIQEIQPH